jgi:hypothetical protein
LTAGPEEFGVVVYFDQSQRQAATTPFLKILGPSYLAFHGGDEIEKLRLAHAAMGNGALGHDPICKSLIFGCFELNESGCRFWRTALAAAQNVEAFISVAILLTPGSVSSRTAIRAGTKLLSCLTDNQL